MCGKHHALLPAVFAACLVGKILKEFAHAFAESFLTRKLGLTQKRHGKTYHPVIGIAARVKRNHEIFIFGIALVVGVQTSAHINALSLENGR